VIIGGLITATLLNLLVVPSLYLRFAKGWRPTTPDDGTSQPQPA
jgi:Cu/Ag efflux pump CusA